MNHRRPPRRLPLPCALSAALLGAGLLLAQPTLAQASREAGSSAQARHYEIAAAPLAEALNRFAAQSGVVLVFDAATLRGLQSRGLSGRYELQAGFKALLADTGLEARPAPGGGYLLQRRPEPRKADAGAQEDKPEQTLPAVRTKSLAHDNDHGGVQRTDELTLKRFPTANGDVTSVLKLNPAVQFDNAQLSSLTLGEIAPADVSINGAKYYQNLFLLDGLTLNNDLDPAFKNPAHYSDVPGASQGMPADKDLICNLEVHDSNVSARYGGFQGGVVKAEICEAKRAFSGRISYTVSRSEWTEIFVDPTQAQALEDSYDESKQPKWLKETWRANLQFRPTRTLGVVTYLTSTRSLIPLKGYTSTVSPNDDDLVKNQSRRKTDALVKLDWRPEPGQHGWLTLRHEPLKDHYFNQNGRDTGYDIRGGGSAASGGFEHRLAGQRLRHDFSYSAMENSRRGDVDYYKYWYWSEDKNWGDKSRGYSMEGAWGDVDTTQRSLSYSLSGQLLDGGQWLGARQDFSWGLSLNQREAAYERLKDHPVYIASYRALINNCTDAKGVVDTEACSLTPTLTNPKYGQYFKSRDLYQAGRFEVNALQGSLWLEEQLAWERVNLRAGLRLERDQLAGQATLAPRLAATYKITADGASQVNLGLNRYYGRSFFNAVLREKRETLKIQQTRGTDLIWVDGKRAVPLNRLDGLDVPYDDELALGLSQAIKGMTFSARWVHRESRDQLTRKREKDSSGNYAGTGPYVYTNEGRGSADTVTLELNGQKPWLLAGTRHNWGLSFSRSQVRTNHDDYEATLDLLNPDEWIQYRGEFMRLSDKPADNYSRPWTGRLHLSSEFPAANLSLYQFARWQAGYRRVINTGKTVQYEGNPVDVWETSALPSTWSWDIGLSWQPRFGRHRPYVTVNIENLSNRKNIITSSTSGVLTYERGRSFQLQAGYEF